MGVSDTPHGDMRPKTRTQDFLMTFLALTITLFAVAIVIYGVASGSVGFSGSIDVGLITSIITITALMAILRSVFGKNNVS
jgi:hypothetical protein